MGSVGFRGTSRRPIERTLRNQFVKNRRPFFLLRSYQNSDKSAAFFLEDLFFLGDHMKDKTVAFFPSVLEFTKPEVIFELAPGPRLSLGAPAGDCGLILYRKYHGNFFAIFPQKLLQI